jgi:hypothetical protein
MCAWKLEPGQSVLLSGDYAPAAGFTSMNVRRFVLEYSPAGEVGLLGQALSQKSWGWAWSAAHRRLKAWNGSSGSGTSLQYYRPAQVF